MAERPQHEMVQKSHLRETFFSVKNLSHQRPDSVHTEFMETDWEEDDILSEFEDDEASPRPSLESVSHRVRRHIMKCHFHYPASPRQQMLTLYIPSVWSAKYDHTVDIR